LEYGEAAGYRPLRERLAEKMRGYGVKTGAEEILVTNGCQQSLSVIRQALVKPGDTVCVENPTYPGALRVLRQPEIRSVGVPVTPDGLDLDVLEGMLQHHHPALIYTTPAFHNPTGRTMILNQRRRLLELALQYGVPIVEDDIYSDLRYEGQAVPALKALDHAGIVIYLSSFSKVGFPGLRVGWMVAPPRVLKRLVVAKETQDLHTNVLGQAILAELVRGSLLMRHLKKVRSEYAMRRDGMISALKRHFPEEAEWVKPEGGMSLWITLPQQIDAARLLSTAIEKGVVFSPGVRFYLSGGLSHTMRLTFTLREMKKIEEGVRVLGTILKQMLVKSKQKAPGFALYRASLV
jgi:DNA-binding transcriptional MocR family regulator